MRQQFTLIQVQQFISTIEEFKSTSRETG